ncbi:MAG: long-chain fatty acid--CoA ligase [Mycobacterium sp.]|nr:MAG: long-chain fatty acid--CoA ligase [Mycobacterium sp.]
MSTNREIAQRYLDLAKSKPGNDAVIYRRAPLAGCKLTYADIANRSDDLMTQFRAAGLGVGARCAVTLADTLDLVPALLALWRLDATAVLVDPAWGGRLRSNITSHSGANFALDLRAETKASRIGPDEFSHQLPDGTALLGYTSGSTGDPKAIPFTHAKLALTMQHSSLVCAALRGGASPKRIGYSARLSGSGVLNLNYMWAPFADAAVVVLPELTVSTARHYWGQIDEAGVEQTYLFPAHVEIVNQLALRSPLRVAPLCLTGSAPIPERLQRRFQERFGLPLLNCYGIMEAMCIVFFGHVGGDCNATAAVGNSWFDPTLLHGLPHALQEKLASGTGGTVVEARLVDDQGAVVLGPGQGELQLSGPTVMDYYYGNPAATAGAFDGHWFRTGDIARRDETGIYTIIGRRKHVVMKGGFSIYLTEVEEATMSIPGVIETVAVPLDLEGHEDIGLLVRLAGDCSLTATDIRTAICDQLGAQRAPYRVVVTSKRLPRTGPEKLDRRAASQLWAAEVGGSMQ